MPRKTITKKESVDARGAGSITKITYDDKSVVYRARIRIGTSMQDKTKASLGEARSWLRDLRVRKDRVEAGVEPLTRGTNLVVTYGQVAAAYLEHVEKRGGLRRRRKPTPTTLNSYQLQTKAVLAEGWKDRLIAQTTPELIDDYVLDLDSKGLASSTVRHRLDRISQMIEFAVRRKFILVKPCEVERPRLVETSEREAATEEQLAAWLEGAANLDPARAPDAILSLLLAADAGLRRAEITRLRGRHVLLKTTDRAWGSLHIAVESEDSRTKSGKGREVPILSERLAKALRARAAIGAARVVGSVETPDGVSWLVGKVGAKLHSLRHRFVTQLLQQNVAPAKVRVWAGHAQLQTTLRYARGIDLTPDVAVSLG